MTPEAEAFRMPQEPSAIRAGSIAFKLKCLRKCDPIDDALVGTRVMFLLDLSIGK